MPKTKIILTNARPVLIDPDLWPFVATSVRKWWDGQYEFQANQRAKWDLDVRQHAKGCAIVFASFECSSNWQGDHGTEAHAGLTVPPGGDLVAAINTVAAWAEDAASEAGAKDEDARLFRALARECIADLPAQELDCCGTE